MMPEVLLNFLNGLSRQDADALAEWCDETEDDLAVLLVDAIRAKMQREAEAAV